MLKDIQDDGKKMMYLDEPIRSEELSRMYWLAPILHPVPSLASLFG